MAVRRTPPGPPASPAAHAAAGAPAARRETGRGERGLARLIPGIRAQGRPALSWRSLAEELSGMTAATYVPDPTIAGRVAFAAQLVVEPPRPWTGRCASAAPGCAWTASARRTAARPEHALADLAIDPGLLGFAIARRVDGQVRLASWRRADAGVPDDADDMDGIFMAATRALSFLPAGNGGALRPGAGQEPVGKVAADIDKMALEKR